MNRMISKLALTTTAAAAVFAAASPAQAGIILADDFADVVTNNTTKEATIGGWDTVAGLAAPSNVLTFIDGDSSTQLGFFSATGEIAVNNNMTAGGWDTTIDLAVSNGNNIELESLVLDLRLTTGSGGDNDTNSKSGQVLVEFFDAGNNSVGQADLGGNIGYPSVEYQRTLDLTGITLVGGQDYTMVVSARGTGFGHNKALQALELNGDLVIPEPGSLALLAAGGLCVLRRRRA